MDIVVEYEGFDDRIVTVPRDATVLDLHDVVGTTATPPLQPHEFELVYRGEVLGAVAMDMTILSITSAHNLERHLDSVGLTDGSRVVLRVLSSVVAARRAKEEFGIVNITLDAVLHAMAQRQWAVVTCLLACDGISHADTVLRAVAGNRADDVVSLIDAGADVTSMDDKGWSATLSAAAHGHADVLKVLLQHGRVDPGTRHDLGQTALMAAAAGGHPACVELLLDAGAAVNAVDDGGWTALLSAMADTQCECGRLLLRRGADPNVRTAEGSTALMFAAGLGCGELIVTELLHAGADPNAADTNGRTALMAAAEADDVHTVACLLSRGADANARDTSGRSALRFAAESRRSRSAKILLQHGADPSHQDVDGQTALMVAMDNDDYALAKLLVAHAKDSTISLESADQVTFADDSTLRRFLDTMASEEQEGFETGELAATPLQSA